MPSPFDLKSFRQQHLLIEFTALKHVQPLGIYVSLTQGDPTLWNGVLFIRKGPYNPAILRFHIAFPAGYPFSPPLITFHTDIFHPLLTPLTTATFSSVASESDPDGTAMQDRLPPGAFSLRHGFPRWYPKMNGIKAPSIISQTGSEGTEAGTEAGSEVAGESEQTNANGMQSPEERPHTESIIHVVDILRYVRQSFESATLLDSVPFEAAGNPGAWYAWRAHRQKQLEKERSVEMDTPSTPRGHARTPSKPGHARANSRGINRTQSDTPGRPKRPSEWNWEGVWEQRVKRAVQESLSEGVLFGAGGGESEIGFMDVKQEDMDEIRGEMRQQLRVSEI